MSRLRAWVALLAGTSFLAGVAAGLLLAPGILPPPPPRGPFADFEERFTREFALSPERSRGLHLLLEEYHQRVEALKSQQITAIEEELVKVGEQYRRDLRELVLSRPDERRKFDELAAFLPTPLPQR